MNDEIPERSFLRAWWRKVWRITVGSVVIIAGIVMLVTPGPGIAAIIAGLAIMADEFPPARRALQYMRRKFVEGADKIRRTNKSQIAADPHPDTEPTGDRPAKTVE